MTNYKSKAIASESFYDNEFLDFDYQLAHYNFKTLKPYFRGNTALEIGSASGYMTKSLVSEFATLHIVEPSVHLLSQIADHPNLIKHPLFIEEFVTDIVFDTVVMSHVLEHLESPRLVLNRISKLLNDDGVLIISVPNAKSIHRLVAAEMGLLQNIYELNTRDHQLGHYRVYDMEILKKEVTDAGYTILDSGGIFLKPLTNAQINEQWSKEMVEGFYKAGKIFPENCAEIFVVCKKVRGK